jgi:triosephosphate isomerase (TIM)
MKVLAANWKMNHLRADVAPFLRGLSESKQQWKSSRMVLFPPAVLLPEVQVRASEFELRKPQFQYGPQNISGEDKGAYTGEISPFQAMDFECSWALVGHSERRQLFGESSQGAVKRAVGALSKGLEVMLCVGESLAEREAGHFSSVLKGQLAPLAGLAPSQRTRLWLAYEPVWAIGTGKNASVEEAVEAHRFIQSEMERLWEGKAPPVLYGGSVKAENAADFLSCAEVSGVLVGGASLSVSSFLAIAASIEE